MSSDESVQEPNQNGFAIASLVFGILALIGSVIVVGIIAGAVGILLGLVHICRRARSNGMAIAGISLSLLGIALGVSMGIVYYKTAMVIVEAFQKGMTMAHDEWKGVVAPDITVTTLEGQTIKLSDLRGKRVVIDFWATWCGPCRMEIPHFIKLREEVSADDLVIVGISSEDVETLKAFVAKQKVTYPIASAVDLPAPFDDVSTIPTTFFIDRQGVIQEIVVGYRSFDQLKQHATAADYAGEVKSAPDTAESGLVDAEHPLTLIEAWTANAPNGHALTTGDWDSDGVAEILIAGTDNTLRIINQAGQEIGTATLPDSFASIELGRHPNGPRLLGYSNWGSEVTVMDKTGTAVWDYSSDVGINGAHWGDLDGDGTDEMIVGMNGGGGLHAVSADGKKLWQVTDIGNVWNQAVISATKTAPAQVFATEAGGSVQVFDNAGKRLKTHQPQPYSTGLSAMRCGEGDAIQILAGGNDVVAINELGQVQWSTVARSDAMAWRFPTTTSGDIDGDGKPEWAIIDVTGELVLINQQGGKLAALPFPKNSDGFAITSSPGKPGLLVTLHSGKLRAHRSEPHDTGEQ